MASTDVLSPVTAIDDQMASAPPVEARRSSRARKAPVRYTEDDEDGTYQPSPTPARKKAKLNGSGSGSPPATVQSTPRQLSRKAKQDAVQANILAAAHEHEDIVGESLAPMTADERGEWESWIELESEPSFFNTILKEQGVEDVKITEVFSMDEDTLSTLPKPVHGLIFLYEYVDEDHEPDEEAGEAKVWFANQTTDNACATVAMLNIVMNAEGVELGDELTKFKQSTKDFTPAVRGYAMSTNRFLLATHNSLARRIDLLNAALGLEAEYEDFTKKRKPKKAPKKKKKDSSAAFHFIAYVQANGHTWELDGLQAKPRCLGPAGDVELTTCAAPIIQERMMQAECNVNLLALCQSPVAALRHELLLNLRKQVGVGTELAKELRGTFLNAEILPPQHHWKMPGLDVHQVLPTLDKSMPLPTEFQKTLDALFEPLKTSVHLETKASVQDKLNELTKSLKDEWMQLQARYMGEYRAEAIELGNDIARVAGRKKDCMLLIHEWLKRLAIAGKMQEVFEASQ